MKIVEEGLVLSAKAGESMYLHLDCSYLIQDLQENIRRRCFCARPPSGVTRHTSLRQRCWNGLHHKFVIDHGKILFQYKLPIWNNGPRWGTCTGLGQGLSFNFNIHDAIIMYAAVYCNCCIRSFDINIIEILVVLILKRWHTCSSFTRLRSIHVWHLF